MKKLKFKLSNLCYFKSITRTERLTLLREFEEEVCFKTADDSLPAADSKEIYETYRKRVIATHKNDKYKTYLFVLSLVIISCSLTAPLLFIDNSTFMYGAYVYSHYVLYPVLLVSILLGFVLRKINLLEYKYHLIVLAVQIILTVSAGLFILYKIADALSAF